ncbi:MAG: putative Chitin deacetylase, partial [Thermomicrobiales bacterium]|nr:putative Chitin deacetylase [Thermomicrobiales bacterium]
MRRFTLVLVMMVVVLLGVTAPGGQPTVRAQDATPAAGATARTDVRYVVPFGPDGLNPGLTATTEAEGLCDFPSSAALDRPDAWDCTGAEGQIYDPCFENPFILPDDPGQVACLESPFTTDVVVLNLTAPLLRQKELPDPAREAAQDAAGVTLEPWDLPWALELANGDRCTLLHGTLIVIAG